MRKLPVILLTPSISKTGLETIYDDKGFIKRAEEIGLKCGYRPIGPCWMTLLIQPEGKNDKDGEILRYTPKNLAFHLQLK